MTAPLATRARMQDLAAAILVGGDPDETLEMILARAKGDLDGAAALLLLPLGRGSWSIELAEGEGAGDLLGRDLESGSPLATALTMQDGPAAEGPDGSGADGIADLLGDLAARPRAVRTVSAGPDGMGLLVVIGHADGDDAVRDDVGLERAGALASLVGFALHPQADPAPAISTPSTSVEV